MFATLLPRVRYSTLTLSSLLMVLKIFQASMCPSELYKDSVTTTAYFLKTFLDRIIKLQQGWQVFAERW